MADPKAPSRDYRLGQLCEALGVLPIDLGTLLQRNGFAIVSEADRKVLEAVSKMKLVKEKATRPPFVESVVCRGGGKAVVDAEWNRRTQ